MVVPMGYESLSSVVLVAIAALLMFVWAPRKARRGMKRASEHRSDRFSASLHLVDESGVTRFNDTEPPITKGLLMQAEQQRKASRLTPQRIARVRELRRAAIRRRRIIVCTLLAAAVLVLVLALTLHFSPLYALIPFALDVVMLGFGAHASAQARAWEAEVAAVAKRGAGASQILPQTVGKAARAAAKPSSSASPSGPVQSKRSAAPVTPAAVASPVVAQPVAPAAGADTDVMMTSEIRAVLDQARAEQAVAHAERTGADAVQAAPAVVSATSAQDAAIASEAAAATEVSEADRHDAAAPAEPDDATNELARISPSHALDAFELASGQDLISFTLGAPRSGRPVAQAAPESMEIKSTRQVSKAVPPVAKVAQDDAAQPGAAADAAQDVPSDAAPVPAAQTAQPVEVEAPEASAESLGVDVDAVIARRGH